MLKKIALFTFLLGISILGLSHKAHGKKHVLSDPEIRDRVVKLIGNGSLCSGEQVRAPSGVDYILTAAHCRGLATNGYITVYTEGDKMLQRRVIAEDMKSDLLLLEGLPNLEGLHIAASDWRNQVVHTHTHGNRFDTYKTSGVLINNVEVNVPLSYIWSDADEAACKGDKFKIQESLFAKMCMLDVEETATTALIVPGSSGGPVVDNNGDLVGVVSAGDHVFGYLVRLHDIQWFINSY